MNQASQRQEVNLYTLDFRRSDQAFSSLFIVKACLVFFGVLMCLEAFVAWNYFDNQSLLAKQQSQQQATAQRLANLKQSQPLSQRPKLELQLSQLQKQVQQRRELEAIIGGQKFGNFDGFSEYLSGIARQANPDLSLTQIRLLNGGANLELQGWARKAEAVPRYLQSLRDEDIFEQVRFGVLKIEKNPQYANKLLFSLGQLEDDPR